MDDKDLSELLKAVVELFARQLALADLLREQGVTDDQIQDALKRARTKLGQVPRLAYLRTPTPSNFQGLAALLESIR